MIKLIINKNETNLSKKKTPSDLSPQTPLA